MTNEQWLAVAVSILSLVAGVVTLGLYLWNASAKFTKMQASIDEQGAHLRKLMESHQEVRDKVNVLYEFNYRRGEAEAMRRGLIKKNSPAIPTEAAKAAYREIVDDLVALYNRIGRPTSRMTVMYELEKQLGPELVQKVCNKLGVDQGACWVLAALAIEEATATKLVDGNA